MLSAPWLVVPGVRARLCQQCPQYKDLALSVSRAGKGPRGPSPGSPALVNAPLLMTLVGYCLRGWDGGGGVSAENSDKESGKLGHGNMTRQPGQQLEEFSLDEVMCCYSGEALPRGLGSETQ